MFELSNFCWPTAHVAIVIENSVACWCCNSTNCVCTYVYKILPPRTLERFDLTTANSVGADYMYNYNTPGTKLVIPSFKFVSNQSPTTFHSACNVHSNGVLAPKQKKTACFYNIDTDFFFLKKKEMRVPPRRTLCEHVFPVRKLPTSISGLTC
jgi:hypothetical protein